LRSPLIVRVDPNLVHVEGVGPVESKRPTTSSGLRSIAEPIVFPVRAAIPNLTAKPNGKNVLTMPKFGPLPMAKI
jgi:hypothetical protein